MEPGRNGREEARGAAPVRPGKAHRNGVRARRSEDERQPGCLVGAQVAAMEPGHEDREDAAPRPDAGLACGPAMEPGHENREDRPAARPTGARSHRRNGARSRRPGEDVLDAPVGDGYYSPQRSPVTKTGKTASRAAADRDAAARRNGARSRRPGRRAPCRTPGLTWPTSRNGARSRRPGRPVGA